MKYRSCVPIDTFALVFNGLISRKHKCISFCCEGIKNKPMMALDVNLSPQQTVEKLLKMREDFIMENIKAEGGKSKRKISLKCIKCNKFTYKEHSEERQNLINYVNLSMYPSPCQCKCIYCDIHNGKMGRLNKKKYSKYYEKIFDILDYAENNGLIAKDAVWQVSNGEITIHPFRNKIIDKVKDKKVIFFTNGFVFDKNISNILHNNSDSAIDLSIDAGTDKTWLRVKGVDNFNTVIMNLKRYYNNTVKQGQIILKYIIIPGVNDNLEDFEAVMKIMKELNCGRIIISRDIRKRNKIKVKVLIREIKELVKNKENIKKRIKYFNGKEENKRLIESAAQFTALLNRNGYSTDMFEYTSYEIEKIVCLAKEHLLTNKY